MIKRGIPAIDILVCTSCLGDLFASVYQCSKGHSFCESCHSEGVNCHLCKTPILSIRNRVIEEITSEIAIPCKWKQCKDAFPCKDILSHERVCKFKAIQCSLCWGFVTFPPDIIVKHIESVHKVKFRVKSQPIKIKNIKSKKKEKGLKIDDNFVLLKVVKSEDNHIYVTFQTLDYQLKSIRTVATRFDQVTTVYGGEPHLIWSGSITEGLNVILRCDNL
ncbi:unnamed protein product [Blepharisma stoltei]|uniref:RING-type E3 ubiquitin transferase n=1 Tax=Blepharisma stoltei TaxID=1481888 RepID=A0AAU9IRE9_9CILI|nr:unnamed protein product [Blepharisma stoltei]